ncbi:hypothetical protein [Streptomyces sp. NPDC060065]|uniref:hypothetical protein n=1 Tax=Streptomyces sp. NPDC060065 TaxID=3347050 RepID=UPI0036984469
MTWRVGLPTLGAKETDVRELETLWLQSVSMQAKRTAAEPNGPLGDFFVIHLREVAKKMSGGAEIWRNRLRRFADDTTNWRQNLRSSDVWRSSSTGVLRAITTLRIWEMTASAEGKESLNGRWVRSYLLEFQAIEKGGKAAAKYYIRAANLADIENSNSFDQTQTSAVRLRRRRLVLLANAKRISTFMEMRRRPQDWDALASSFGEAAELSERAQKILWADWDRGPDLHRMWESLMRLRAHQASGSVTEARCELTSALQRARNLTNPIAQGGRWRSVKEIAAERHLIDCIEELNKRESADPILVEEHLKRWCQNTKGIEPPPSPRRMRLMELRRDAAAAANAIRGGQSINLNVSAMRRIASEDRYVALGFASVLEKCGRATPGSSIAVTNILTELSSNIRQIDGDTRPLPPAEVSSQLSPSWLVYHGDDPAVGAYASLLRYVRVIAEYLWCVYRDRAAELHVDVPELDPREFRGLDLSEAFVVIDGLRKAFQWEPDKYSTRALDQLSVMLGTHASRIKIPPQDDADGTAIVDLLNAIVDTTLSDLFPLVVQGTEVAPVDFPADIPALRLDRPSSPTMVRGVRYAPPSWPNFALKPSYRRKDDLTQVLQLRFRKPIHLYSAFTWPTPSLVRVLVEGPSDVAALEAFLDHTYPYWGGLNIRIVDSEGDNLPGRLVNVELKRHKDDPERAAALVIIADADKIQAKGLWQDVWRQPYAFAISPDLEGLDWSTLAEALAVSFEVQIDVPDLWEINKDFLEAQEKKTPGRHRTFVAQLEHDLALGKGALKNKTFGYELGNRLAHYENPTLAEICRCIVELADGWDPVRQPGIGGSSGPSIR